MIGINLSFSVQDATWKQGIFIYLLAVIIIGSPVAYFAWWAVAGGREVETRNKIEKLLNFDPKVEAHESIDNEDYRLYVVGSFVDRRVPGCRCVTVEYKEAFGFIYFSLIDKKGMTEAEIDMNKKASDYMSIYNQCIYRYVNLHFPEWRTGEYSK